MSLDSEQYLPKPADLQVFLLSDQISRDYTEILRNEVVPKISEKYGIKLREIRVLMCLESSLKRHTSAADVADMLRQDRATITRSSIILIGEKCIYTTPNLDDSRVKNLHMTDKGIEIATVSRELFNAALIDVQDYQELESLTAKDVKTLTILEKLEKRARFLLLLVKRNKKLNR